MACLRLDRDFELDETAVRVWPTSWIRDDNGFVLAGARPAASANEFDRQGVMVKAFAHTCRGCAWCAHSVCAIAHAPPCDAAGGDDDGSGGPRNGAAVQ